jgi:RimJ/RimL family protein N-acetyltransferase
MDDLLHAAVTPRTSATTGGGSAPHSFSLRRLDAERLTQAHLPILLRMQADERIMRPMGGVRNDVQTTDDLERHLSHWSDHGFGTWILRDPVTREVIGQAGLSHLTLGGMEEIELMAALFPDFWGRGLATDAVRACVTIGRDWLGLHSMVGLVLPSNAPAQRVLRKASLTPEREVLHGGQPHLLFRTD